MGVRDGATGGRWSSAFVVRALGIVVVIVVAVAGLIAVALTSQGDAVLPVEHGIETPRQGSS